jgi:hypothetical protein
MTEPVPEDRPDVDAEVDKLLGSLVYLWGMEEIAEARGRLRRALMYAWYDGQSAGLRGGRAGVEVPPNPWTRATK